MKAPMQTKKGVLGATVLAGVLAIGGFASTNTLVFNDTTTNAGFGSQDVEVIQITDVDYTLDATDKSLVTAVTFLVSPFTNPNADAQVWFRPNQDALTAWMACTNSPITSTTEVLCTFASAIPVEDFGQDSLNAPSDMQLVVAE